MTVQSPRKITKDDAIDRLWRSAVLSWKLDSCQKQLYNLFYNAKYRKIVWKCSRRLGKSFTLLILALEYALKHPNSQIKYACPTAIMAQKIIIPTIRTILADCPVDIKPNYNKSEKCFYFKNNSIIQIEGIDEGNAEKLRGTESHLSILDEAAFMDDLEYVINDILLPQCLTTNGKILMSSTPPKTPNHPYEKFAKEAQLHGSYIKKSILDAVEDNKNDSDFFRKRLNPEILHEIMVSQGGEHSSSWRREFLCVDEDTLIKTEDGYKPIKNVEIGNKVLTHDGSYKEVKALFINPLEDRKMYRVRSSNNEGFLVTEGHRFLTAYKNNRILDLNSSDWTKVEELVTKPYSSHYLKIPIDKTYIESNISEDLAYLVGWHLAEGHCSYSSQQQVLSLNKQDPFKEIDNISYKIWNKRYKVYNYENSCFQAHLLDKNATDFYKKFGKSASSKKILKEFKYAKDSCKKALLKGLFKGDGYLNIVKKKVGLVSVSQTLINDVSDMLHSLGILHCIHILRQPGKGIILGRSVNVKKCYTLRVYKNSFDVFCKEIMGIATVTSSQRCRNFINKDFAYYKVLKVEEIHYNKKFVFDIEVKDNHSYCGVMGTFHNCEDLIDIEKTVIPEFTEAVEKKIVRAWPKPKMYDGYTAMDLGYTDFTGILFGYYDFINTKVVIEDEVLMSGREVTTKNIAESCRAKEREHWLDHVTLQPKVSYLRVSDDDMITINDLHRLHNIQFIPTKKDEKETAINEVRMKIQAEQIIINPRCKNLIYQLKTATWAKNRKTFERTEHGGHYDLVDALIYLIRNIQYYKNPYPASNEPMSFGMHSRGIRTLTDTAESIKSLFTIGSRTPKKTNK